MKGVTSVKKLAAISAALVIAAAGLSGCASQSAASSAEATRENPMILSLYDSLLKGKEHELLHRNFTGK